MDRLGPIVPAPIGDLSPVSSREQNGPPPPLTDRALHIILIVGLTSIALPFLLWVGVHRLRNRGVRRVRAKPHRPPSVGPIWLRTWHGWTKAEDNERRHLQNKQRRRRVQFAGFRSATQDYSWIFWDPGGHGRREYVRRRNRSVLRYLPAWMRSYPHGWSTPASTRPESRASGEWWCPSADVEHGIELIELDNLQAQIARALAGDIREHEPPHDIHTDNDATAPETPRAPIRNDVDPLDSAATVGWNNELHVDGPAEAHPRNPVVAFGALTDLDTAGTCSTETVMRYSPPPVEGAGSRAWGAGSDETDRATHHQLLRPRTDSHATSVRSGGGTRHRYPGAKARASSLPLLVVMRMKAEARGRERRLSSAPEPKSTPVLPEDEDDQIEESCTNHPIAETLSHYETSPSSDGTYEASDAGSIDTSDLIIDDYSILAALDASISSEETPRLQPHSACDAARIPSFALDGPAPGNEAATSSISTAQSLRPSTIRRRLPSSWTSDPPVDPPHARTPTRHTTSSSSPSTTTLPAEPRAMVRRRTPSRSRSFHTAADTPRAPSPVHDLPAPQARSSASPPAGPSPSDSPLPSEKHEARARVPKIRSTKNSALSLKAQALSARSLPTATHSLTPMPGVRVPTGTATTPPRVWAAAPRVGVGEGAAVGQTKGGVEGGSKVAKDRQEEAKSKKGQESRSQRPSTSGAWWRWYRGN